MLISHLSADAELVKAARAGDTRAFNWLVARYQSRLIGYTRYLTRTTADAEDVTQRTFMALWRVVSNPGGSLPDKLGPWLYRVAHNQASKVQRGRYQLPTETWEDDDDPRYAHDTVDELDLSIYVRGILDGIPEEDREVLYLHWYEDLTFEAIGTYLGMKRQSVHQRYQRALRRAAEFAQE